MKILLPVDGSEYTKRTLAYFASHDEMLPGKHEFIVVTAVAPLPQHVCRFLDSGAIQDYYRSQAEEVLAPIRAFAKMHHWNIQEVVAHAHATDAIVRAAEADKPDMIVMGTHGHSALGSIVLGSVANGVLARCKVPVLLIR